MPLHDFLTPDQIDRLQSALLNTPLFQTQQPEVRWGMLSAANLTQFSYVYRGGGADAFFYALYPELDTKPHQASGRSSLVVLLEFIVRAQHNQLLPEDLALFEDVIQRYNAWEVSREPPKPDPAKFKLNGTQRRQLHAALLDAFNHDELRRMVNFELDIDLSHIAGGSILTDVVSNLILWAERVERLRDLIDGALAERPGNHELRTFAQSVGIDPPATV